MIPRKCRRCGTPIWVWPWQQPLCRARELQACLDREAFLYGGYGPEVPVVWLDPQEWVPDDIEKCSRCGGFGSTAHREWEVGPVWRDCTRCGTTGVDPSLCPA